MSAVLAAAALLLTCPPADSGSAAVEGRVLDATARAPVAHAAVEVRGEDALRRARTDRGGTYRVRGLPAGWLTVTVRRQGYRTSSVRVRVERGQCMAVDFTVELDPVEMPVLRVGGLPSRRRVGGEGRDDVGELATAIGPGVPAMEALRSTPLGGAGVGRAVRRSVRPQPADPSVLYLRGTTAPLKQIILDGAPVQTPFHLSGLLSSRPPGVVDSSTLRSGGPSPRFGGGLLYTLDLRTRSPGDRESRHGGSADLLGATGRASGPLGAGSYLASVRTLHPGRRIQGGRSLEGRRYSDGLLRVTAGGEEGLRVSATGFRNRASTPLAADGSEEEAAVWGNAAGSLRLATGSRAAGWRATVAASRYRTELPLTDAGAEAVEAGVDAERGVVRYEDRRGGLEWSAGVAVRRTSQRLRPVGGDPSTLGGERGTAHRLGGFVGARWHLSDRLSTRTGLRTEYFSADESVRPAPRVAATLRLSPETTLRLSAGRVHQLMAGWSGEGAAVPGPADVGAAARAPFPRVAGASRLELELEHADRGGLRLGAEAHFRRLDGVSAAALIDTIGPAAAGAFEPMALETDAGGLYSSGLDAWGGWRGPDLRVWANYSLTWLWGAPGGSGVSSRFAARQVLSGGADVALPAGFGARGTLSGSWGLPMTPLPVTRPDGAGGPAAAGSEPGRPREGGPSPYVRLDLRVERSFSTGLFGTRLQLAPYAKLINALDRDDALFHRLPAAGGGLQAVNPVPVLPVVGIEWSG